MAEDVSAEELDALMLSETDPTNAQGGRIEDGDLIIDLGGPGDETDGSADGPEDEPREFGIDVAASGPGAAPPIDGDAALLSLAKHEAKAQGKKIYKKWKKLQKRLKKSNEHKKSKRESHESAKEKKERKKTSSTSSPAKNLLLRTVHLTNQNANDKVAFPTKGWIQLSRQRLGQSSRGNRKLLWLN